MQFEELIWKVRPVLTYKLQAPQLKGHKPIPDLNNVHEGIQLIWGQYKEVAADHSSPSTKKYIAAEYALERPGELLIEQTVQVIRIGI